MADESDKIADSEFTVKWLEGIIKQDINTNASIKEFSSTEVGIGRGLMSDILEVKLIWDNINDNDDLPTSIVLKIPTIKQFLKVVERMDDDNPVKIAFKKGDFDKFPTAMVCYYFFIFLYYSLCFYAHKCEVMVYDLFRRCPPANLKLPKSYFGQLISRDHQGVLVFEDLSAGVGTTIAPGLTKGQMMQIAESLANLHAYSLTNKWQEPGIDVTMEKVGTEMTPFDKMVINGVPQLKKLNAEYFDPLADKLLVLCKSMDDFNYVYHLNEKMGIPDVFCHGDLHAKNVLWVPDKDGNPSDELMALLDWQASHPGSIGEDFARCFASSVSADVRRDHYVEILDHYYNCMTKQLATPPPFAFSQLIESYKRCFKFGVLFIIPSFLNTLKFPGSLGENPDEKVNEIMNRCKALIEDAVEFEAELGAL